MSHKRHSSIEINELLSEFMRRSGSLSQSDLTYVVSSLKTVKARLDGKSPTKGAASIKRSKPLTATADLHQLAAAIEMQATRDGGLKLLADAGLTRRELELLAKIRSVYISKDDTVSQIKDRIIEAFIGARLNSRAIRGDSI